MLIGAAASGEQALPCFLSADPQIVIQCLPCDLRQLESGGPTCLALANTSAVDRIAVIAVRRHVIDAEHDEVAAAQFAVDGKIEQRQVACTTRVRSGGFGPVS